MRRSACQQSAVPILYLNKLVKRHLLRLSFLDFLSLLQQQPHPKWRLIRKMIASGIKIMNKSSINFFILISPLVNVD